MTVFRISAILFTGIPEMHTDKTGNASIEFYSSDESGEYIITVEGITGDGKTGASTMPLIINSR